MKKVIILTGDEERHTYFRKKLSNDQRFQVIASFCEGVERSLSARTFGNKNSTELEKWHVTARTQAEADFFGEATSLYKENSRPIKIEKGEINSDATVKKIVDLQPDLLVCYGSSLIKTELLSLFERRFLNVHLGLSPYYRGSGTNVWPLINDEPHMVGATFMYIDPGIDTGQIIHQLRADIFLGDSPHSIGNRLIRKMSNSYADIIANFENLTEEVQPDSKGLLYKRKDFDRSACFRLYQNFRSGMIQQYLEKQHSIVKPYIVNNKGLMEGV